MTTVSNPTQNNQPQNANAQPVIDPSSPAMQTLQKVSKVIMASLLTIAGLGGLAIGVTIFPFSPEMATGTLAASVGFLGLASCLFQSIFSSPEPTAPVNPSQRV